MIIPVYTHGDWVAIITDGAVALLPPSIDEVRLAQVWDALRESPDLTHSLTVLARGGLVGLPPFALVSVVDGHVRGFLRGDVRLLTADAHGTSEHSAAHVATWAEINVADAGAVTVAVPASVAPVVDGLRMPALAAVVRASSVEVRLRAAVEAPRPAPVVVEAAPAPARSETTTRDGLADDLASDPATDDDHRPGAPSRRAARRALAAEHPAEPVSSPQPSPDPVRDAERAREYVARRARARASAAESPAGSPMATTRVPTGAVPSAAVPARAAQAGAAPVDPGQTSPAQTSPAETATARDSSSRSSGVPDAGPVARRAAAATPQPVPPTSASVPPPPLVDSPISEMTVVPATEPEPLPSDLTGPDVQALLGDDDRFGSTVLSTSLVEIRRQMSSREAGALPGPFPVPAVPRVQKIRMSSGLLVPLDRAVLIGRAPVVSRVAARDLPRLVTVVSPNQDISRTHAQVHTVGEDVLVTDLNSTNGMLLTEAGQAPRRLRSGEPTPISPGALVDLGDGVTFTLERDR